MNGSSRQFSSTYGNTVEQPLAIFFDGPAVLEPFGERAAVPEVEAGLERDKSEMQALAEFTASLPCQAE